VRSHWGTASSTVTDRPSAKKWFYIRPDDGSEDLSRVPRDLELDLHVHNDNLRTIALPLAKRFRNRIHIYCNHVCRQERVNPYHFSRSPRPFSSTKTFPKRTPGYDTNNIGADGSWYLYRVVLGPWWMHCASGEGLPRCSREECQDMDRCKP